MRFHTDELWMKDFIIAHIIEMACRLLNLSSAVHRYDISYILLPPIHVLLQPHIMASYQSELCKHFYNLFLN